MKFENFFTKMISKKSSTKSDMKENFLNILSFFGCLHIELPCNIFTVKMLQKSSTKIYVFQSCRYISPLVLERELKLSEIKDHEQVYMW
jgi:hypothetical protein